MRQKCPVCQQEYEFQDEQIGQMFSCLECGKDFVIQKNTPDAASSGYPSSTTIQQTAKSKRSFLFAAIISSILLIVAGIIFFVFRSNDDSGVAQSAFSVEEVKQCIAKNDVYKLSQILHSADVNQTYDNGETLLWLAVRSQNMDIVQTFLAAKFDVNKLNKCDESVIYEAVRANNLPMIELLIANGARIDNSGINLQDSVWGIAAENNYFEIIRFFNGSKLPLVEIFGKEKVIFRALQKKNNQSVIELIDKYDIDTMDLSGNSLLSVAVATNNVPMAELLISKGANVHAVNSNEESVFFHAVKSNNQALIDLFMQKDIDFNQVNSSGVSLPMLCVANGNIKSLEKFLTENNINLRDSNGITALGYACRANNKEAFDLLLSKDAQINSQSFSSADLTLAIAAGNEYAVKVLLDKHTPYDLSDDKNNNLLMLAATSGNITVFNTLLKRCTFDYFSVNDRGQTALDIAKNSNKPHIASALLHAMAPLSLQYTQDKIKNLQSSHHDYSFLCEQLENLKSDTKIIHFSTSLECINNAIKQAKRKLCQEQSQNVAKAIVQAQNEKYFEDAINVLKKAIANNPHASNLHEAQTYQKNLEKKLQEAIRKNAERKRREENFKNQTPEQISNAICNLINSWLSDMQNNRSTGVYWRHSILAQTFFSVRDWKIIGAQGSWNPHINIVNVSIQSSTQGGIPIHKTWQVTVMPNEDFEWKISSISDN